MKQRQFCALSFFLTLAAGATQALAQAPAVEPAPAPPPEPKWYEPVAGPFKIEGPAGSVKLGVLLQPQFESIGSPTLDGMSNNLFIRRTRVLLGATLFTDLDFFFETDFANLFKAAADTGVKSTPGLNIQDAFFTYKFLGDQLKMDVGYMLVPVAHNALQGATTLYSWDYFANTFRHSNSFGTSADPAGRDAGLQLRGLVANGLVEYRLGMFQGLREPALPAMPAPTDVGSKNFFRVIGRVQVNLLDPETGFFYAGTYLGGKKVLSFGASYDFQDSYKHWGLDGLLDLPLGPGVLTAQVNVVQWDGDDWIPTLPKQLAIMGELGYTISALRLSPILRFEQRSFSDDGGLDETRIGGGLAYWAHGHNFNLKAFFTHIDLEDAPNKYNAFNLQSQVYFF